MAPPAAPPRLWLPDLLRAMSERFSLATALRFAELFGGQYLHLPNQARPEHPVARAMGVELLAWVMTYEAGKRDGGERRIIVPKGPDRQREALRARVAELKAQGAKANAIAADTGLHVRSVHAHLAALRDAESNDKQGSLL